MAIQHAVIGVGFLGRNRASKRSDKHVSMAIVPKQRLIKYPKSNKNYYESDGFLVVPILQIESRDIKKLRTKLHKVIDDLCNEAEKMTII